jgi:hypothetical protein
VIDPALLGRLRTIAGNNLEELAGATVTLELPLTNAVVNRLIEQRLSAASGPVTAVQVDALDEDTFGAQVTMRMKMIPTIRIVGRIEEQPELPQRPSLGIRWSMPGMGALSMFAAPVLAFLNALPRGLRAEDDRILVDVVELLRSRGLADLLPYLRKAQVHTRRGAFIVRLELRV